MNDDGKGCPTVNNSANNYAKVEVDMSLGDYVQDEGIEMKEVMILYTYTHGHALRHTDTQPKSKRNP